MQKFIESKTFYMAGAFNKPSDLARLFKARVDGIQYDTLVGTGLSGALVVPALARCLRKRWLIVRKKDGTHSSNIAEGELGKRWIFVDDLIASGATRLRVRCAIRSLSEQVWGGFDTEEVGTYLYKTHEFMRAAHPLYRTGAEL